MTDAELVALLLTEARLGIAHMNTLSNDDEYWDRADDWRYARDELRAAVLGRLEAERGQA